MKQDLIEKAYSSDFFRTEGYQLIDRIAACMDQSNTAEHGKTVTWIPPEKQLEFWTNDFQNRPNDDLHSFWDDVFSHSMNLHSRGYMGHQVSTTPAITALTGAVMAFLNNSTTVYEIGMAANAMEKVVLQHLAQKFGYASDATGIVTSGGSLGNLTALVTARTSAGIPETEYDKLAILVSVEAHYSIERAAEIMGIPKENILQVASDEKHCIRTELLESTYQEAISRGKKVFCVVGCAGTTAVGAYDDLTALADFAEAHNLWFHVDGAHGAAVVFSETYKKYLKGIERSDSLVMDFHKMLMAPAISTAVLYNTRRKINEFSPDAAYLWQNQLSEEWYNSAKHTMECTKPITILHTYAIMKRYGDELYRQHVDKLYDLGHTFAEMVRARGDMELAVEPSSNIVCFRCVSAGKDLNAWNAEILQKILEDGEFYIVSTTLDGKFYLRVSLMNPLTERKDIERLLDKIEALAK